MPRVLTMVAAGLVGGIAGGATVGSSGYTNDFSSQPPATDWSTLSISGAAGNITTWSQLDAIVMPIGASTITDATVADATDPPAMNTAATWGSASTTRFLQTRPTGNNATLLLCTLVNGLGQNANQAIISYNNTIALSVAEEVAVRAYYSTSGEPNSWTMIPEFSGGAVGRLTATLNVAWPAGSTLYLLWADDNGSGSPDTANEMDNFSATAVPAPLVAATITNPSSQNVDELQPASFSVTADGNPTPAIQWYTNGVAAAGASSSTYTIPQAPLAFSGMQLKAVAWNTTNSVTTYVTSQVAVLTVKADTVAPVLVSAQAMGVYQVLVIFSERVSSASATDVSNYQVSSSQGNLTISNATLDATQTNVVLSVSRMTEALQHTLTASNIKDLSAAGNTIAAGSHATFVPTQLISQDIGNPAVHGSFTDTGNGIDITAGGLDIGGTSDQFQFVYESRAGDFDLKVRLEGLSLSDPYAEGGLMARSTLTANSPFAASLAGPGVGGCYYMSRGTVGGSASQAGSLPVNYPYTWLRLQRVNLTNFYGYASMDGLTWTPLGTSKIPGMPTAIYVGFAAASHSASTSTAMKARDFAAVTGTPAVGKPTWTTEPLGPCSRKTGFVISEIMYHPRRVAMGGRELDLEYIEIYNSQPFFEDISGYSIGGDVKYTFPAGTVMKAGEFMVLAKVPGDVKAYYGLTNVLGYGISTVVTNIIGNVTNITTNIVNSLNNGGGTIRLLSCAKAVLLQANYGTTPPWPTAADGGGHSLVLAKPSYGEGDTRAWAASDLMDGSPGTYEAIAPEPTRPVVINEFLANSDGAQRDFIELYNHSTQAVDLSGCWLSDAPDTNKFRIPDRTIIQPGKFVSFNEEELGFALSASGEKIFLVNSNQTRVIDAVRFGDQSKNVSYGRCPDGSSTWRELASLTPGGANSGYLERDVVINEIMYQPITGDANDEYVELYNRGASAVDLSGWRFSDGITFTFPSNTIIAAANYLVVAKKASQILSNYPYLTASMVVGDYSGTLANGGERIALAKPEEQLVTNTLGAIQTNIIHPVVNEVIYGTSERWGVWAAGGGSSLELVDPRSDNRLADNWADSDETAKAPWSSFTLTGNIGETLSSPINDNLEIFLLGLGECQVDDVGLTNATKDALSGGGTFEGGITGWTCQGSHDQSRADSPGYKSTRCLRVIANSRGDNGANRIRSPAFSVSGTVTFSAKARWLHGYPEVLFRIHGGGLEMSARMTVPKNLGTPGLPNSRAVGNAGPAISEVAHQPVLPAAGQSVLVTARVHDPDEIASVNVRYRLDPSATFLAAPMKDDGTGGDALANDGIYTATLPGQPAGTMVAFYIEAADAATTSATNIYPERALGRFLGHDDAPSHELLVRFGDIVMPGAFPTYHVWLTSGTSNRWYTRDRLNNGELDATFVYNDCRVIYNMRPLYAGSPWHSGQMTTGPCGANRVDYVAVYPDDEPFFGANSTTWANPGNPSGTTFSDTSMQTEQTSYLMFKQIGLHYNYRRYMHVYVNGDQRSLNVGGPTMLIEDCQQPNGDAIDEWYADDTDGELYKIEDWFEFADDGYSFSNNDADLERRTTVINGIDQLNTATYRFKFRRRAVPPWRSSSDYTNFFKMVDVISPPSNSTMSPFTNVAQVEFYANIQQWMRVFACQHTVGNWDAYGYRRGKNGYFYKPVNGPMEHLTWDIDFTMGVGGDGTSQGLFETTDPRVAAMWNTPLFLRYYWQAYQDILDGPLNNSYIDPILDAKAAAFTANGVYYDSSVVATIKSYTTGRRSYLQTQLSSYATTFSVNQAAQINSTTNLVIYTGSAPVGARRITVNGADYPLTWTSVTAWSMAVPIGLGTNQLVFAAYTQYGTVTNTAVSRVAVYQGPAPLPTDQIVINEIMFDPAVPGGEYIELFNTSSNFTFDLGGWVLNGVDYTFPAGSYLAPRSYLVLARDRAAFVAAYGPYVKVFGYYNGNLQANGETLTLIKPGVTADLDQAIDKIRYDSEPPWPTTASGTGSSLQLTDPAQDNSRVGNWQAPYVPAVYSDPISIPAQTNSGWRQVSVTGKMGLLTTLMIYMTNPPGGDVYIDDLSLVAATNPAVSFIKNGDFENTALTNFSIPTNFPGTTVSTDNKHGGNSSLHIVCNYGSSASKYAITQAVSPAPANNTECVLSFWYLVSTNALDLNVRFPANTNLNISTNVSPVVSPPIYIPPQLISTATNYATPGAANTTLATLPAFPPLWLNELQAENLSSILDGQGHRVPWVELYNAGTNTVPLEGLYLARTYTNLTEWAFPAGATIGPGQFKVIFADGALSESSLSELHTSFALSARTGSVALSRLYQGKPQVLDYVDYAGLSADYSYGSLPDGQPFTRRAMYYATPGRTNDGTAAPLQVFINEWMAANQSSVVNPVGGQFDDWFELYNAGVETANLEGFYLTDDLGDKTKYRIPAGYTIPPGGYLLVWADSQPSRNSAGLGDLHVNFQLARGGDEIGMFGADGKAVDMVTFGPQQPNISEGRCPDGSTNVVSMSTFTERKPNQCGGNRAPVLEPIDDQYVYASETVAFTALASDPDGPSQVLTYSLDAGAPANATIGALDGLFSWTPLPSQAPSTNIITVRVTDNGTPAASDTTTFSIVVMATPTFTIGAVAEGNLTLSIQTLPGRTYQVVYKAKLSDTEWLPYGEAIAGTGETISVPIPITDESSKFIRIVAQ